MQSLSIILPAKNEEQSLTTLLPMLRSAFPSAEIIVVDDGSRDNTKQVCLSTGVTCISHPYSKGNGAAIKSGARAAKGEILAFMDADSQHTPQNLESLIACYASGYDMVVGARGFSSQATVARGAANTLYNRLASWMVEQPILDLTSGMRVVSASKFRRFLYLLPNGFSYPTTITMAFFRAGYSVGYHPIVALERIGMSHIRPFKDGFRFLLIIFKIGTLYSPLKLFTPVSLLLFGLGALLYLNTYIETGRFTNMSALLFIASILVFMIGLVSEQVTSLIYKFDDNDHAD